MSKKFRFHVLGIPHTKTHLDYVACAYTQKAYKFCKMMTERGHYVIHYGVEGSNPICTENVNVVSAEIYDKVYGEHDFRSKWFRYDMDDECYQTFFKNAIKEIQARKGGYDIVLPFWGAGTRPICDALSWDPSFIVIEPGIGYGSGSWASYRVFESYAIFSAYCGTDAIMQCNMNNYDVIIPNYFDVNDFVYNSKSRLTEDPYFLFLGRVYDGKGVNIALQVCEKLGVKLKIAGQLDDSYAEYAWPSNVEFIGYADKDLRNELMSNAIASFIPSQYLEPFGGVQVENLLCGTPTITSDWGAFAENNIHGVTGYRCRTFNDYLEAALNCLEGKISHEACREQGLKFTLDQIAPKYEKFFEDVINIYEANGWYEIKPETEERIKNLNIL